MELNLLFDVAIIFALSTIVNYLFTRIKIPTIIGYLLTGIIAGPYALGIIHEHHSIELMAEIGVVLLMFTIGLEFSIGHLMKIRKVVFVGGFFQLIFTAATTFALVYSHLMNWRPAIFIGFLVALSSTAVVLKLLQERSEITSNYGRTVVGILIFQDVILIPLMLFTPMLAGKTTNPSQELLFLFGKTIILIGLVFVGNRWVMPRILKKIAHTKSQELFMMTIMVICLSVALLTHQMGISLAFGAFLAGLMISGSDYSHNAFSDLVPLKDIFTSFFFVSIGMLFDTSYVVNNPLMIFIIVIVVVIIKAIVAGSAAFLLGHTLRGVIMTALALSQVGEFSFILAQSGVKFNIMSGDMYQLFLAVAIITMSITPFLIMISPKIANNLERLPLPKSLINGLFPLPEVKLPELNKHIVFIGKDSIARNLATMAKYVEMPSISIVMDPGIAEDMRQKGKLTVYGDAINEPVLKKAHVDTAEIIVISVGNRIASLGIIEAIRKLNQHAEIIVRTKYIFDIEELYEVGATEVIPEEFETAVAMFEQVLLKRLVPQRDINKLLTKIKGDHYGLMMQENQSKESSLLFKELPNLNIIAIKINNKSPIIGRTLADIDLRKQYGITIIAILRNDELIEHPAADFTPSSDDLLYIMGRSEQIAEAYTLFMNESE